jgi:glycosyltransferase involved in cell wall biosynthesis
MTNSKTPVLQRILFIATTTHVGGAEKILSAIAKHLHQNKVTVAVCSLKSKGPYGQQLESLGIPVYSFEILNDSGFRGLLSYLFSIAKLVRLINSFRPQVVHAFLFRANLLARIAARLCRVPINISSIRIIENDRRFYFFLDRLTSSLVTRYLAVSERVKEATSKRSHIDAEKIRVIHNGIDISSIASCGQVEDQVSSAAKYGIGPHSLVCGTVARLHHQKGICHLIDAFVLLRADFPNLKLLLVGDGPERANLANQAAALGVSQEVIFAGQRNPPIHCLKVMNVFALPSLYEGFPNALLEAMAAHVPVVASDVGGVNEMVRNEESGLLVPPGSPPALAEAIRLLLLNPEKARLMATVAFDRIRKEFSLEAMLREYEDLYEELLSQKSSRK